ncbi:MAG: hypothetical protein IJ328_02215 [Muribaculaceae bacterium]|nr:hypothetical protein [Muribaculaceae bacterium]
MKFSIKHILSASLIAIAGMSVSAQTLNSLYFLDGNTQRHLLNPALTCESNWVSTPLNMSINMNSNLGLEAFLRPYGNNEMITFLHPSITAEDAMSKFQDMNTFEFDVDYNILTVGFKAFGGINSIGLSVKSRTGLYLPKDIFTFMKAGQESDVTEYVIDDMSARTQNYAEIALGHSRAINKKLTVGAKVKFLLGVGYANANVEKMRIYMSDNKWMIEQKSTFTASKGINLITKDNGEIDDFDYEFNMGGFGLGLDLGATYKVMDNLNVSLAVTDLGFIKWSDASVHNNLNSSFEYTGFDNIAHEDSQVFEDAAEDVGDQLEELIRYGKDGKTTSHTSSLYTTFRAGAEYGLLKNKISVGLLGTMRVGTPKSYTEGMLSFNFKPFKYFKAAINGSVANTHSSLGGVICLGNFFIGGDYILAKYSKQVIPVDAAKFNFAFGTSIKF